MLQWNHRFARLTFLAVIVASFAGSGCWVTRFVNISW